MISKNIMWGWVDWGRVYVCGLVWSGCVWVRSNGLADLEVIMLQSDGDCEVVIQRIDNVVTVWVNGSIAEIFKWWYLAEVLIYDVWVCVLISNQGCYVWNEGYEVPEVRKMMLLMFAVKAWNCSCR